MTKSDEIEVYREIMVLEQSYYHVLATRKVGYYPKIKYYAPINKIKYIGEFVGCRQGGGGDGSWYYGLYKKDNMLFTSRNLKLGTLRQNNSDSKDSKGSKSSQIVNKK